MAWLRIDDGFAQHPKVISLNARDRWTWLEILCYCARYQTKGNVPAAVREVVRGATKTYLETCADLGLLERVSTGSYHVHDWDDYNGRDPKLLQAERQKRYRERRDTSVTDAVTEPLQERNDSRDENVTRAQPRGRVPVPNPSLSENTSSSTKTPRDDDDLKERLRTLQPTTKQWDRWQAELATEPTRVQACLTAALANGRNVAGYFDDLISRGEWPKQHPSDKTDKPLPREQTHPFTCPACDLRFKTDNKLTDHLFNVHGQGQPEPAAPSTASSDDDDIPF